MSIDLFTLLVQILNFLILLFVLNSLLYKPLMKMIDERKKIINEKIENAEFKLNEAYQLKENLRLETENFEEYKKNEEKKVLQDVGNLKNEELIKMKNELEIQKAIFIKKLEEEKEEIITNISKNICKSVNVFITKIFSSLTSESLKETLFNIFIDELKNIDDDNLKKIRSFADKNIKFISNTDLNNQQKDSVKKVFADFGINNEIIFEINEDLIFGSKIIINSFVINSNIENITVQFTNNLREMI